MKIKFSAYALVLSSFMVAGCATNSDQPQMVDNDGQPVEDLGPGEVMVCRKEVAIGTYLKKTVCRVETADTGSDVRIHDRMRGWADEQRPK
jgi:hypothetical protein